MNQGGFSSSQMSQAVGSPNGQQKGRNQSMTPITCKQAREAKAIDGSSFTIDGQTIAQVRVVGLILNVDHESTQSSYGIDDGSGQLTVKMYRNDDAEDLDQHCREDIYVRVVGTMRELAGQRIVVAFQIQPLKSMNEITLHNLDVIHTHLRNTKGPLESKKNRKAAANNNLYNEHGDSMYKKSSSEAQVEGMDNVQQEVLQAFKSIGSAKEQGASVNEVIQRLRKFDPVKIREAVDFLSNEGHLYSTLDETHFKCTDE
ncbi:hypothetical protein AAMO2058_000658300 [Amorphochlora amoebiformis]